MRIFNEELHEAKMISALQLQLEVDVELIYPTAMNPGTAFSPGTLRLKMQKEWRIAPDKSRFSIDEWPILLQ